MPRIVTDAPNRLLFHMGLLVAEFQSSDDGNLDWDDLIAHLGNASMDNMGLAYICYWTNIQVE